MSALAVEETQDVQVSRLAEAIAQRVGAQRYKVWFHNSTRLDLKHDALEIVVPNDFISEWINQHFKRTIQEAASEVLGCSLPVRFNVMPQMFVAGARAADDGHVSPAAATVAANRAAAAVVGHPALLGRGPAVVEASIGVKPDRSKVAKVQSATVRSRYQAAAVEATGSTAPAVASAALLRNAGLAGPSPFVTTRAAIANGHATLEAAPRPAIPGTQGKPPRLRHDLESFIVGASNQLAYNAANYVSEFPGAQYNPLFIHGGCGLGKTHLLQGLCKKFIAHHPTKRWAYMTGEEFTNEFVTALRGNKIDAFRRRMRDLDLLVIDDVHFLSGKKATQEEFLHTFNAIEAMGKQIVMVSDNHPKMIEEFGESLINRFVSGMVVRIDPPNYATRCEILRSLAKRHNALLSEEVIAWIARRVTQNVRELEGAINRIAAHTVLTGREPSVQVAQEALGDLDRQLVAPVRPENILGSVCTYFGLEHKDLMSGRRQRTISLARSVAMYLVRKTSKLSFPEIAMRMGKRNHSTVISACRRIERAVHRNELLAWTSNVGDREEEAGELIQRLEEHSRAAANG